MSSSSSPVDPSPDHVREVLSKLRSAFSIPSLKEIRWNDNRGTLESGLVEAVWSQPCLASLKTQNMTTFESIINPQVGRSAFGVPMPEEPRIQGRCQGRKVTIHQTKNDKGTDVQILQSFSGSNMEQSINLTDLDVHGKVYMDQEFGGRVCVLGNKVAYVAEAKDKKNTPFPQMSVTAPKEKEKDPGTFGQEYKFKSEFGEQLVGKSDPVIVLLHLETRETETFAPTESEGWMPGQILFHGENSIIGTAVSVNPRPLGVIYCTNRPKVVFKLCLKTKEYKELTSRSVHSTTPRLSPSGALVWLQRDLGAGVGLYPGPHQAALALMQIKDLENDHTNIEEIVPVQHTYNENFCGLWDSAVPERCFSQDGRFFILNTVVDHTVYPVIVDLKEKAVFVSLANPHVTVFDVMDNKVVGSFSQPTVPPKIAWASLSLDMEQVKPQLKFNLSGGSFPAWSKHESIVKNLIWETLVHKPTVAHQEEKYQGVKFNSIYVGPKSGEDKSVPLVVFPHGGPHSVVTTRFIRDAFFFNLLGYAVLFVNYRGSTGRGQESVDSLLGHVGENDVRDVHQAGEECLQKFAFLNPAARVLFGGSHGGFLVTHLAGQYPGVYKASIARNPVINIATMATVSDIPDWTYVEAGEKYAYKSPTPDILKAMYEKSPISHADKVKDTPVLLLIGKADLRVPPSQGFEYYYQLKALNKEVEMNVYDDNHPLAKVPNDVNVFMNSALFMNNVIKS